MFTSQRQVLNVHYRQGENLLQVGRLVLNDRKILFEYAESFLEKNIELSPFKLPLKSGIHNCNDYLFEGLFGVFNDSLPDGWGRLLLDRKLQKLGITPNNLTPLDRLCYVGKQGLGALVYEPEFMQSTTLPTIHDLDRIANECLLIQQDETQYIDELLVMNGSSSGARPKILVTLISNQNEFEVTNNNASSTHTDWIIKFRSSIDPIDIGSIEYAYHLMAAAAGLDVPPARLFKSKQGLGYFGVQRFDRVGTHHRHMHTASGLLHADHRIPSLDYESLIKATAWLTKDIRECEKQFRNITFNILSHNRDDHSKNFSFLMDEEGRWQVSPAYDLTFSSGPAGEHCTTITGEGKNPKQSHLIKLAHVINIHPQKALDIIDEVKTVIGNWNHYAKEAHVETTSRRSIEVSLSKLLTSFKVD